METFWLKERVEDANSLRKRDFLIISCKEDISSLCFVQMDTITVVMAEVTILKIKYYMAKSIMDDNMKEMSS